ncbi:MAG: SRPBCC domain-containing protein [Flavipsychrobacter sp.]|nr:SRPBCC domain-containing protein [Flavipsychrobacter sp.]
MEKQSVIVEHTYNAPAHLVWKAITDPEQLKQWWLDVPGFKAEAGCKFNFRGGAEQHLHLCEVVEVVEEKKISYSWRFAEFPGDSLVTWELFPEGDKTKVVLTHSGIETFRGDLHPEMKKENFMGWSHVLDKMLQDFVAQTNTGN